MLFFMANLGLKQKERCRDLCHFAQSLSKVPRNVFSHYFNPDLDTLHGTFFSHMPSTFVQCAYLNTFKDKLNILNSRKEFDSVCEG